MYNLLSKLGENNMQKPIFLEELITEIKQGNSLSKLKLQAWFTRYVEERQEYNITYENNKEDDGWIYRLIDMYRDTGDREQDYITAYNYYFESAEKDDCEIKCNLGVMYKKGKGVKRDYQKALYWFTKASEQGCERAKFHIGLMYEYGEGVKKNDLKALDYFIDSGVYSEHIKNKIEIYKKEAEVGEGELQYKLGLIYENGIGIRKNSKNAIYWYEKAAINGIRDANNRLACLYYCKHDNESFEKAFDLLKKHAEIGDASTQCLLANIYKFDECDYENALKWYEKASAKGDCHATHNLALLYFEGEGTEKNPEKAFELLKKAAEQGNEDSLEVLENLKKDYEKSKKIHIENNTVSKNEDISDDDEDFEDDDWDEEDEVKKCEESNNFTSISNIATVNNNSREEKKAEIKENKISEIFINDITSPKLPEERYIKNCKTSASTFYHLGQMYYYGDYIPQDYCKAFRCYAKATELGNRYAQKNLSMMYYYGEGVEKDYSKAFKLYNEYIETSPEFKLLNSIFGNRKTENNQELKKAAEDNDASTQYQLGRLYFDKNELQKDYKKAFYWTEKAAENKYQPAIDFLPINYTIPVMAAAKDNDFEFVKESIENGININTKYDLDRTLLMVAAMYNSFDVAKLLIENGAELEAADSEGKTPICFAAISNSYEVGKLLCDAGAKLDFEATSENPKELFYYEHYNEVPQKTPLMYACINNSAKIAELLIRKGVDYSVGIRLPNDFFKGVLDSPITTFEFALKNNSIDVIKIFLDNHLVTPQEVLSDSITHKNNEIANIALDYGADPSESLKKAIDANAIPAVKLLIERGAYCDQTALHRAISQKHICLAKLLIDAGAESNVNKNHRKKNLQFELYPKTKDATQFMVNGTPTGGKGPTVYAAVNTYIDSHPNITLQELQTAFPDYLAKPGFGKMIRKVEDVTPNEWSGSRFNKHPISLSDGTRITVSTQWKPDNMLSFIVGVKKLGIAIEPVN